MERDTGDTIPTAAESIVFENFGEDFGGVQDDPTEGLPTDDGEGDEPYEPDGAVDDSDDDNPFVARDEDDDSDPDNVVPMHRDDQLDDMRVTHTGKDKKKPLAKKAEVTADRNGNLIDKSGKVVARAGAQARFYQNWQRERRKAAEFASQAQDFQGRLTRAVDIGRQLHSENQQLKAGAQKLQEFGFTPNDQINAMQLYSDLRTSPEATVKKILTRMAAQGITVGGMQPGSGGGAFDVKTVMDMIRGEIGKSMNPLLEQRRQEQQERETAQRQQQEINNVKGEVSDFFRRNPDARRYISTFQKVMADPRYANMSLGEVYVNILRNNQNRQQPSNRQRTPSQGSLPRGRGTPPNANANGGKREPLAPLDASWDKIIGDVLDQSGYRKAV